MKYSICIEMMFLELDFYDRFAAAKEAGFDYVEFWSWSDKDLPRIKQLCKDLGLKIASFSGDQDYSLCDPAHLEPYCDWMVQSFKTANFLECETVIIHSNQLGEHGYVVDYYENLSQMTKDGSMLRTLLKLAPIAEQYGVTMALEALNTELDHVGNHLFHTDTASDLIRLVDSPRVKVIYDMYHMQIMHGNLIPVLKRNFDAVSYIHIADNPGRCEPGTGEINYLNIIKTLKELNYQGVIGFEMSAATTSKAAMDAVHAIWQTIFFR